MPSLFQRGIFQLHSGEVSLFKIECDALDAESIVTCAEMLARRVHPFNHVHGVPQGGLRLADAMREHRSSDYEHRFNHLIIDDVYTTGGSMDEARTAMRHAYAPVVNPGEGEPLDQPKFEGAVLFARKHPPLWIVPLFELSGEL